MRDNYAAKIVQPSDWVARQRAEFGQDYTTALGRAFAKGLLGDDTQAKARYDAGKRFSRLYSALIEQGRYRSPLNPDPRSAGQRTAFHGHSDRREDQDWLFGAMNDLDREGLRPWLDQLLSLEFTDAGPVWLTRLLAGGRDPYDKSMLRHAVMALDVIAPAVAPVRIVSVRA